MEVGDKDLFNPSVMRDNMHDWVAANENMAKVLAAKGYRYQFVFRPQRQALRRGRETANSAGSSGIRLAGVSDCGNEERA